MATGFIAGRHLGALAAMPDVDVVAVADPVVERAAAAADQLGARSYDDGLAMLGVEDLDARCGPASHRSRTGHWR
ncbi:Gfo/Idh/MocA family oxidoreductase [Modestobacter sp. DSM 44400]|uniref:Gfo/Idh/MocA family oxidoreductase n=1 Tax=Modestobacter sp. DSM 44400 TaxID=1550230 RepID=UPI0020C85AF3|nr:Gfo/Idh/MocA family oxidoreductase [Modestobacter sp. DSM 44400]